MRHATLLWGSAEGFDLSRSQRLEAYESEEQSVADLDKDGYLDIVMTNYHAYTTRKLPCFIYWGGPEGYSESRRTGLPGESTLALTVADLNRDGWMDIVPFNHLRDGDHGVGTNIFWGSPQGFSFARRLWIQTFGPHFQRPPRRGQHLSPQIGRGISFALAESPGRQTPLPAGLAGPNAPRDRGEVSTAERTDAGIARNRHLGRAGRPRQLLPAALRTVSASSRPRLASVPRPAHHAGRGQHAGAGGGCPPGQRRLRRQRPPRP